MSTQKVRLASIGVMVLLVVAILATYALAKGSGTAVQPAAASAAVTATPAGGAAITAAQAPALTGSSPAGYSMPAGMQMGSTMQGGMAYPAANGATTGSSMGGMSGGMMGMANPAVNGATTGSSMGGMSGGTMGSMSGGMTQGAGCPLASVFVTNTMPVAMGGSLLPGNGLAASTSGSSTMGSGATGGCMGGMRSGLSVSSPITQTAWPCPVDGSSTGSACSPVMPMTATLSPMR